MTRYLECIEEDAESFPHEYYRVAGFDGIACRVLGWETEPLAVFTCECGFHSVERDGGGGRVLDHGDDDCEHDNASYEEEPDFERTGRVVVVMVGDDGKHAVDAEDIEPLNRAAFCGECGQIGCHCDGYAD